MNDQVWKLISRAMLYKASTPDEVSFVTDRVVTSTGRETNYTYVDSPYEVVVVVAETWNHNIALVSQYRYLAQEVLIELPSGSPSPGSTLEEGALFELQEETGVQAEKIEHLGDYFTGIGFTNQRVHVFWASVSTVGQQRLDPTESIEVDWVPRERAVEMAIRGQIRSAPSALALLVCSALKWSAP